MKKIILLILFIPSILFGYTEGIYDHVTYYKYTGKTVTLAWELISNAIEYEIEIIHAETEKVVYSGRTTSSSYVFTCPKVGHYIFKVKSWNSVGSSEWAISTNPENAKVNGVSRSFWVYSQIPPVTNINLK